MTNLACDRTSVPYINYNKSASIIVFTQLSMRNASSLYLNLVVCRFVGRYYKSKTMLPFFTFARDTHVQMTLFSSFSLSVRKRSL